MEDGLVIQVFGRDDGLDHVLHEVLVDLVVSHVWGVLSGNEDGVHALGDHGTVILLVLDSHLGLAIRPQPGYRAVLPHLHTLFERSVSGIRQPSLILMVHMMILLL